MAFCGTRTRVAKRPSGCTSAPPTCDPSAHAIVMAAPAGQFVPSTGTVAPCAAVPPLSVGGSGVGVGCGVGVGVGGTVGVGVGATVGITVGRAVRTNGGATAVAVGMTSVGNALVVTLGALVIDGTVVGSTGSGVFAPVVNPITGSGEKSDAPGAPVGLGCFGDVTLTFTGV